MIQAEKYDKIIMEKIQNGELEIDPSMGKIYGKMIDDNGKRKEIGYFNYSCKKFTFITNGRSYIYPCNRAIYLFVNKTIPKNHVVFNIDNNPDNNNVKNLDIKCVNGRYFYVKAWSEEETLKLKKIYKEKSYQELSDIFGRSIKSIRHAIKNLSLSKSDNRKKWTKEDDKKLLEAYGNPLITIKSIAQSLNKSESSIRLRANRLGNIYRSDKHLQEKLNSDNFYLSFKGANQRGSIKTQCCLCNYEKYIELHHIDGNNRNHNISNIATLCPNHHAEVTGGEHKDKILYSIWQRKYSDGNIGEKHDNLSEVKTAS